MNASKAKTLCMLQCTSQNAGQHQVSIKGCNAHGNSHYGNTLTICFFSAQHLSLANVTEVSVFIYFLKKGFHMNGFHIASPD